MDSVARIHVAWELKQAGQKAEYIAERVGVSRATVYCWWAGIRQRDIQHFPCQACRCSFSSRRNTPYYAKTWIKHDFPLKVNLSSV